MLLTFCKILKPSAPVNFFIIDFFLKISVFLSMKPSNLLKKGVIQYSVFFLLFSGKNSIGITSVLKMLLKLLVLVKKINFLRDSYHFNLQEQNVFIFTFYMCV